MISSVKNPKVVAAARLHKRALREDGPCGSSSRAPRASARRSPSTRPRCSPSSSTDELHELAVRAREVRRRGRARRRRGPRPGSPPRSPRRVSSASRRSSTSASTRSRTGGCVSVLHEVRDPGQRRARSCVPPMRPAPTASCSRRRRSTSTTRRPFGRPRARSSTCRWFATSRRPRPIETLRARGHRILAMDAHGSEQLYVTDARRPDRLRVRQRGPRPAAGRRRARGCDGARSARGEGGVAQSRGRRERLPVRARAPSRRQGRIPRIADRRGRPRHPVAADGDEGLRLRPGEALVGHDR